MSLSGILSDLSLGELLQLLADARKSGMLEVYAEDNVAWLGLRNGGIERVALAEDGPDRKTILAGAGLGPEATAEAAESCLRAAALHAVQEVLAWPQGEFSFDARAGQSRYAPGPEGIVLQVPLALESLLASVPTPPRSSEPRPSTRQEKPRPPAPVAVPLPARAAIVVDPDLGLLERIKEALKDRFDHVHLFQDIAPARARVQQYMARGELPVLILSQAASDAAEHGSRRGWHHALERVRALSSALQVVLLATKPGPPPPEVTAVLSRRELADASDTTLVSILGQVRKELGTSP